MLQAHALVSGWVHVPVFDTQGADAEYLGERMA